MVLEKLKELYEWTINRLERTLIMGIRFVVPKRVLSIHAYLGMLTFVTFVILGITGALLMFYYKPTLTNAYDTVEMIYYEVPFGYILRNIHYHASNAMVFLAIYHMVYQLFSGRYKLRNEVIWVTGILLGVLTILEAYTGYDLILNERAVLAINIGAALTNSIPYIGPTLSSILIGTGFSDILIRFYAFHVFIIPLIMLILIMLHFPRNLILDIPMIAVVTGAIIVVGGLAPVPLGTKFDPNVPPGITVPEWYLSGLYAFIRTGIDRFVAGVLIPTIWIVIFLIIPFIDRSRKLSWRDRPFIMGLGIAGLVQVIITTVWGFYVDPMSLVIDPYIFYGVLALATVGSFAFTYGVSKYVPPVRSPPARSSSGYSFKISESKATGILILLLIIQIIADGYGIIAYLNGAYNLSMIAIGGALIIFALIVHILRIGLEEG